MGLNKIKSKDVNQNGYNKNSRTLEKIGALFTYPVDYTPDDCLPCNGFILNKEDYSKLYDIIGKKFNTGTEAENEFRIPDFNISGRFLQPGMNVGNKLKAGLPNIIGGYHNVGIEPGGINLYGAIVNHTTAGNFFYHSSGRGSPMGGFDFNASRYSSIYGSSTTVQPPSQIIKVCIKYK